MADTTISQLGLGTPNTGIVVPWSDGTTTYQAKLSSLLTASGSVGTGSIQLPVGTTLERPQTPSIGSFRYNSTLESLELYTSNGWLSVVIASYGSLANPATSGPALYNYNPGLPNGLYYFKNFNGEVQQLYCDVVNGGWVLVASNNASSNLIPGGTARQSSSYYLNREGAGGAVLGSPDPNSDYIIGGFLNTFTYGNVRVLGWGLNSTNGTYSYSSNLGTYIDVRWALSTSGNSKYTEIVPRANITISGNSSLYSAAAYFIFDGIRFSSGANANQTTIGGTGVQGSNGLQSSGTYLGHGTSEGSYEGWYPSSANYDCQGYTTWVK